jgi:hypothetical protein
VEDETNSAMEEEEEAVSSSARTIVDAIPEVKICQKKKKKKGKRGYGNMHNLSRNIFQWRICKMITMATSSRSTHRVDSFKEHK